MISLLMSTRYGYGFTLEQIEAMTFREFRTRFEDIAGMWNEFEGVGDKENTSKTGRTLEEHQKWCKEQGLPVPKTLAEEPAEG